MPYGTRPSPEEFYSQCVSNAHALDAAARRLLAEGDPTAALACAWGADVFTVQAVLWERVLVAAPVPARKYFRAAEAMFAGATARPGSAAVLTSGAEALQAGRALLLADFDADTRAEIGEQWPDPGYLRGVPVPTADELASAVSIRLQGLGVEGFVAARREEAQAAMVEAQALRVRGETAAAVQAAYDADMLAFEAYLVESAAAAGDAMLLTVTIRWELAVVALAGMAGLPEGFVAAVTAIRDALGGSMVDADADRWRAALIRI